VALPESDILEVEESLTELNDLGKTAGYEIAESQIISVSRIFAPTYMSKDMAGEIGLELEANEIDVLLFNEDLSPAQSRNLEKLWDVMIVDRTELILKIFQTHARTQEAKIQVEIAQLKYTLPRLKRMWTHLSRIEGGFGFTKGPGETQIEIDRRMIKDRIAKLNRKLKQIRVRRHVRRQKRLHSGLPLVSLVGYTNAGKTSLLNVLAQEELKVEDKLFATLSPVVRKVFLKKGYFALVADTVGFIKKLPTHLVASFQSTLQEVEFSDLLVVVQDASHHNRAGQMEAVKSILGEIEVLDKPQILVFSKSDLLSEEEKAEIRKYYPQSILVSTRTGEGIERLKEKVIEVSQRIRKFHPAF
jgi:GTP-binding protein HflX